MTSPEATSEPDDAGAGPATDIAAGIFLAAISVFALVWLIPEHTQPASSPYDVSPGFFPKLATWTVLALSAGLVAHRIWRGGARSGKDGGLRVLAEIVVWGVVGGLAIWGLSTVGFLPTAAALVAGGMIVGGCRKWWLVAAVAVLFPVVVDAAAWIFFTVDLP